MFTGIIEAVGRIIGSAAQGGDLRLQIDTAALDLSDVALGDSIATNGVCLTVVSLPGSGFCADVSRESLAHTTLAGLAPGSLVNLEKALTPMTRLGGHIVSGHVDGVAEVVARQPQGRAVLLRLRAPSELARYIAHKGSITIDGVSLTVNKVDGAEFELMIVPHSQQQTIIPGYQVGTRVNVEVDVMARYLERLLLGDQAAEPSGENGLSLSLLAKHGYLKG